MARNVTAGVAPIHIPAWTNIPTAAQIGRVEAQARNDRKGMARSRVNRNPSAASAFSVAHQIARWQRCREQTCAMERVRNGARAIVAVIVKRAMAAAPNVR